MHKNIKSSFKYAFSGIYCALRDNLNLKIHFAAAIVVILLSFYFEVDHLEKVILGLMILMVISAEMVNTSIEEMVDLITTEHKEQAKIAKDVAAGMVLLTALGAVIVGVLIFYPYIFK